MTPRSEPTPSQNKENDGLQHISVPNPSSQALRADLKLALLSARPSARLGFALVIVPLTFLGGVILRYGFDVAVPGFAAFEEMISAIEHAPVIRLVSPVVFAVGPLVALAINVLAILHVRYQEGPGELVLTVKLRWANLLIAALSLGILAMVFVHIVSESAHHVR
jgi:hypothetical protein